MPTWKIQGGGNENSFDFALTQEASSLLINGYVDDYNNTIKVPGKKVFTDLSAVMKAAAGFGGLAYPITGIYFWRSVNKLIVVAGPLNNQSLFYVDMANINTMGQCNMVDGARTVVLSSNYAPTFADGSWSGGSYLFIASGDKLVYLDTTLNARYYDAVNFAVMNPPGLVSHVGILNGYVLMNLIASNKIYVTVNVLNPLDNTVSMANNFFACEYRPDNVLGFCIYNREVVTFGAQSIEVWYDQGISDVPNVPTFVRNNSACYDVGLTSANGYYITQGILFFMDTLQQVYKFDGRNPTIISDTFQKYLADIKTQDLKMCGGFVEGRPCLFLIFPSAERANALGSDIAYPRGVTLCYDIKSGNWALWGEYSESFPTNQLYGESVGYAGFKMKRDKINCSTFIAPNLSGDSAQNQKLATSAIGTPSAYGTAKWYDATIGVWDGGRLAIPGIVGKSVNHSIASIGQYIYIFGGQSWDGANSRFAYNDRVGVYDAINNTWANLNSMGFPIHPTSYMYACSAINSGLTPLIYLYGGIWLEYVSGFPVFTYETKFRTFNGAVFATLTSPNPTASPAMNLAGGVMLFDPKRFLLYIMEGGGWVYNIMTNSWNTQPIGFYTDGSAYNPLLPIQRAFYGAVIFNDFIYLFGGITQVSGSLPMLHGTVTGTMKRLNLATLSGWESLTDMTTPVHSFGFKAFRGKIYVFGGFKSDGSASNKTQIFDIVSNTWSYGTDLPTASGGFGGNQLPCITSPDGFVDPSAYNGLYLQGGSTICPVTVDGEIINTNYRYRI